MGVWGESNVGVGGVLIGTVRGRLCPNFGLGCIMVSDKGQQVLEN